jgi:pyridoxamine 5'-phosphate oxidase
MSRQDLHEERRDYAGALRRADLADDPLAQFQRWLDDALSLEIRDATAFALATAAPDAVPSVRIVLLKAFDADGYVFYSDYRSQKGSELSANPAAAMLFHWRELDRQVRLTGVVSEIDSEASRSYFASRPPESRFAAAASEQSATISDRAALEARVAELKAAHPDGSVPAPERWGGFRLKPERYEFWQGREGRLHDRFRYLRSSQGWTIERLQP